jgi:hypothetical protein
MLAAAAGHSAVPDTPNKKCAPGKRGAEGAETPGAVGAARSASLSRRILCVLTD